MKTEKLIKEKRRKRLKRKLRVRKNVYGTPERPRMTVFKSNRHLYVQVIDDSKGHTLVAASTLEKDLSSLRKCVADAEKLGEVIGKRALEKGIKRIAFDRNGYPYHGIVKAIAEGARKAGLEF
ncbi:50S ribosomal protein L18 [Spirochaeta thermophila]|uniref:Large ribosomal subunit protein uL18 n=1 Tax=Winmispira thermophila (strain ATCC 49972 / DSM 6192 / RI 19.B1) TaxID=665571 RepID=E0RQ97_WINT6|nr:50S ribosomal protein L18 [Spirochaeta thermophila]ADN01481.1 50S ribosomal protein L18 [Spirochaeta thermophila DSM 6192]